MKKDTFQLIKAGSSAVINALGGTILAFSISLKLLKVTGSALGYGTSLIIGPIVGLLMAPIIGKIVDNYPRKKVVLLAEILVILTSAAFLIAYGVFKTPILITAIVVICLMNIFSRVASIAYLSSTPQIVSQKSIQRLNSIQTTGVAMASIVGAPMAGFLFGAISFSWIILIDLISDIITLFLTIWTHFDEVKNETQTTHTTEQINLWGIVKNHPQLVTLVVMATVLNFSDISLQIGVPYVLIHILKYSTAVSGNVQGVLSFGVFLGGIIITWFTIKHVFNFEIKVFWASVIQMLFLGLAIQFLPKYTLIIFVIVEFISGIISSISDPPIFTYIQAVIPHEALGRFNTLMFTTTQILNPIGVFIYSAAFAAVNYQTLYLVNGFITAALMGLLFIQLKTE